MKNLDDTIEALLAGLRDAEPSAGMQRLILETMQTHEAMTPVSSWRRMMLASRLHPVTAISSVCATALSASLIVAIAGHQPQHAPPDTRNAARSVPTSADARRAIGAEAVVRKAPIEPRRTTARVPVRPPRGSDESAVGETQTASFPAPPLALTEQEKLLLHLAHRGDPENLGILNPDVRAAQTAKATEQFQQFFEIKPTEMRRQLE
jgi:hypothetical protein